jgi:hypothetical protein
MTLEDYLSFYAETIGEPPELVFPKVDQQRLALKYRHLKRKLQTAINEKSSQLDHEKEEIISQYN